MLELRGKALNNLGNMGCYHLQYQTNPLISDCVATIGERYKRMDLRIHVHARVGLSEFCAIFQYAEGYSDERIRVIPPETISKTANFDSRDLDNPMLIRIVDLFEPKEGAIASTPFGQIYGFEQRTTTAIVWLQPLDTCLMFRSKQLNHILPFSLEFTRVQKDRELQPFVPYNCFRFVRSVQEGKLIDEMVKRRAQVVSNLPDVHTPVKRRWSTIYSSAVDTLARFRILLCPDNVTMGVFEKGILHRPESVDFSLCSIDLETWAIERVHELSLLNTEKIIHPNKL